MNLLRVLRPSGWTRLGDHVEYPSFQQRRNIVFSQILVLTLVGLSIHLLSDLSRGEYHIILFVVLAAVVVLITYWLNEHNHSQLAKTIFFLLFNLIFFVVSAIVPRQCNVNLMFLPLVGLTFIVYGRHEIVHSILFTAISFTLLTILELTDYQTFGPYRIIETPSVVNSLINIGSAGTILLLGIFFIVSQNHQAEILLSKRQQELLQTNRQMDRFLYSATHDLRSPLNSIKGLVHLATLEKDATSLQQYYTLIQDRISKLEHYITDVLDYSRNGQEDVKVEAVSVQTLINDVIDNLKYMDGAERIRFIRQYENADVIDTNKDRLSIVVRNLLSNAVKYQNINQPDPWIRVALRSTPGSKVQLEVADNGIGIDAELQPKIFDMFFRATLKSTGSGLGLFLVKEALAKINGTIEMTSKKGEGSTFTVTLNGPPPTGVS